MIYIITGACFFLVALIYSSAGFGGGSLYLAILAQFGFASASLRLIALLSNAVVTALSSYKYAGQGWLHIRQVGLLLCFSVPFCAFSATINLEQRTYLILLSFSLLGSSLLMMFKKTPLSEDIVPVNKWWYYPLSSAIGFLSGLTGIGGGVFLSPFLHLSGWGNPKQIAAASALFILVNSSVGLLVIAFQGNFPGSLHPFLYAAIAFAGAIIGSSLSKSFLSQKMVKYLTIGILIFAAVRILIKNL